MKPSEEQEIDLNEFGVVGRKRTNFEFGKQTTSNDLVHARPADEFDSPLLRMFQEEFSGKSAEKKVVVQAQVFGATPVTKTAR